MAMNQTYRKNFSDRYAMLHEQQVLDYLNQRHAPVPKVIVSHLEQSYLEMSHGGMDLQSWIQQTQPPLGDLSRVLSLAIQAVMRVAELGVWHIDIALRNFVLKDVQHAGQRTVWLIDFSNVISDKFPLQKPLWMLPAPHQHPQLQQSLILDWEAFYARHQLPEPANWQRAFDVPLPLYRENWTSGLHVEAIANRWCILAHGIGQMGLKMQEGMHFSFGHLLVKWQSLLNLDQDTVARERLEECIKQLGSSPTSDLSTPRPRARPESTALPQALSPSQMQPKQPLVQSQAPVQAPPPREAPPSLRGAGYILNLLIISLGWLLIDAVYTRYVIVLSWLSWLAILGALLITVIAIIGALVASHRRAWWTLLLMMMHVCMQTLLLCESWVLRVPAAPLSAIGACLAASAALTLSLSRKKPVIAH
jgi:hypothetical protein